MSRVTRFAASDPGPTARIAGFMAHLRSHGFAVGVAETGTALQALTHIQSHDPQAVRAALRSVCAGCQDEAARFDHVFDGFWLDAGRVRSRTMPSQNAAQHRQDMRNTRQGSGTSDDSGDISAPDTDAGGGTIDTGADGKLQASDLRNMMKRDLRDMVGPEDIRAAEAVARKLGMALRDRRSRRRKIAVKGRGLDFRRTIRRALATGGVPVKLTRRHRPDRPIRIVALCDVSGSMLVYARPFLAFLAGLLRADDASDAYLFHTRLVRISPALRDADPMRALNRVTLMAEGIGGGSNIGASLDQFAHGYARRLVDGRSVVIILSDGYDTDPPERLANALATLRKRGCRILWLNPLKGWDGYQPIARAMAAALPHLDGFEAANTLEDLAQLDRRLSRL